MEQGLSFQYVRQPPRPEFQLAQALDFLQLQDNSEDQGIEDYHPGGYHPVHVGEVLYSRYQVIQKLGWGHFSTVWLCKDFKFQNYVAVKIQKSSPHYMQAAFDQVEILQRVAKQVPKGQPLSETNVVHMLNSFVHKSPYGSHFCMVFQILSCNLLQVIKRHNYEGIPMNQVRQITRQCLEGLKFLHERCRVIHTDLKPQNVLLCLSQQQIKQIVQNGQLSKQAIQKERLQKYKLMLGFSHQAQTQVEIEVQENQQENTLKLIDNTELKGLTGRQRKNKKNKIKRKLKKKIDKENRKEFTTDFCHTQRSDPEVQTQIAFNKATLHPGFRIKIADLGNGCWEHHHFSTEIQTRQYRSPEVLIGCKYDFSADIWSLACMVFQLATGNLLFQPKKGAGWSKNQDHIAQILQLFGPWQQSFAMRGIKSRHYFNRDGTLKNIPILQPVSIVRLLVEKYRIKLDQAQSMADFLKFCLVAAPEKRPSAKQCLNHPWLTKVSQPGSAKMSEQQFLANYHKLQSIQTSSYTKAVSKGLMEQADYEDCTYQFQVAENKRWADIRTIDRSFTDLGYIGFSQGIVLEQLDRANFQFN